MSYNRVTFDGRRPDRDQMSAIPGEDGPQIVAGGTNLQDVRACLYPTKAQAAQIACVLAKFAGLKLIATGPGHDVDEFYKDEENTDETV